MADPSASQPRSDDGPVVTLINKRLRALRKNLNRISQMEESLLQGKSLNKDQNETMRSKSSVIASIDELEKLREPLLQAVDHEVQIALLNNNQDAENPSEERVSAAVSDLLGLLYFGTMFDIDTLMKGHENMMRRTQERNWCITYDMTGGAYAAGIWKDLDLISMFGRLLTSPQLDSCLSHKDSLQKCVEHAKLWLENSNQPIEPNSRITYASLRGMLNKIMASDYFTITPEMQFPVEVFEVVWRHPPFQIPVHGAVIPQVKWGMTQ